MTILLMMSKTNNRKLVKGKKKEEKMVKHNISHLNEKMEDYSRKEVHYNSSFHAAMDSRVQ